MADILTIIDFLDKADQGVPVVDVRSPKEYAKAHIPGALNIPLFSNEERAVVGTTYKQANREAAMLAGLEFVGKKMPDLAKQGMRAAVRKKELLVHCWRGGMRSQSMAWLFETMGIPCYLLNGGYKSYRSYLRSFIEQAFQLCVLGGKTGSGKTEILKLLKEAG